MSDVNKQLLDALKMVLDDPDSLDGRPRTYECVVEAIAAAEQAQQAEPVAWKHDCAALLMNDVELWVRNCPHCGKPRTAQPPAVAVPDGLVIALHQARYALREYHVKQPDCGFNKLADACIKAADILAALQGAVPDGYALVQVDLLKSVIADDSSWHAMGYAEPGSYGAHAVDLACLLAAAQKGGA